MKPLDLARRYMEIVFGEEDVELLSHILARNLTFRGPLQEFDSARDYVEALRADPPRGFSYEMIAALESESAACLIYRFSKPGISVPMAQLFQIERDRISYILLIFDPKPFS